MMEALGWTKPLSLEGLKTIANHKYVGGKYTPLDNALNGFWFALTELLPRWLAPNLVTLLGLLNCLLGYTLLWIYSPTMREEPPWWVFVACGVCTWNYQTLDAMDGKQARRLNASSPLGQLFDHGCDALGTISMCSATMTFLAVGPTRMNIAGGLCLHASFFLAQWQEYHTGVLCTSFGPVGVTECQYSLMACMLSGAVFGGEVMGEVVSIPDTVVDMLRSMDVVHILPSGALTRGQFAVILWVIFIAVVASISFYQTLTKVGVTKAPGALLQLAPVGVTCMCALLFPASIVEQHFRMVQLGAGLLIVHLTNQMIVFSMAHQPYPLFQPAAVVFWVCAVLACYDVGGVASDPSSLSCRALLWLQLLVTLTMYVTWVKAAIAQICARLNIQCLTLSPPKQQ